MATLVLTRHGLTPRSSPEQHLGQRLDVPLSDEGRAQAEALAKRLAPITFDRVISSPLVRARQTAEAVLRASTAADRPKLEIDPRLAEMDYGDWEGLTYEEIEARDAVRRHRWEDDPATNPCPNGESGNDVAARTRAFLEEFLSAPRAAGSTDDHEPLALAVGHSTLNRILICQAMAIPIREFRVRVVQSQVNLTALHWPAGAGTETAELLLLNDVAHVTAPGEAPWD